MWRDQTGMGHRAPHADIPDKADKTFPAGKITHVDRRGRAPDRIDLPREEGHENLPRGEGFG